MARHRATGLMLALLAGLAVASWAADGITKSGAGGPAGATEFKSRAARAAAANYTAAVERLNQEHEAKLAAARKTYAAALTAAKDEAMRAANLDEAVRLRDAIADLQKEAPAPAAPGRTDGPAAGQ